jgi:hypothetical protein
MGAWRALLRSLRMSPRSRDPLSLLVPTPCRATHGPAAGLGRNWKQPIIPPGTVLVSGGTAARLGVGVGDVIMLSVNLQWTLRHALRPTPEQARLAALAVSLPPFKIPLDTLTGTHVGCTQTRRLGFGRARPSLQPGTGTTHHPPHCMRCPCFPPPPPPPGLGIRVGQLWRQPPALCRGWYLRLLGGRGQVPQHIHPARRGGVQLLSALHRPQAAPRHPVRLSLQRMLGNPPRPLARCPPRGTTEYSAGLAMSVCGVCAPTLSCTGHCRMTCVWPPSGIWT